MRTLLVDNHDSYTYNVFHLLAAASGEEPVVVNNDAVSWRVLQRSDFDAYVLSPGPGRPERWHDFGVCRDILPYSEVPVFGICLGHQGLGNLLEGGVNVAPEAMHGRLSHVRHSGTGLFAGVPQDFSVVRYHSLAITRPMGSEGEETAWADDGVVMGVEHSTRPMWGVQFHPESIATEHGLQIAKNFFALAERRATPKTSPPTGRNRRLRRGKTAHRRRSRSRPEPRMELRLARVRGGGADRAALRTALRRAPRTRSGSTAPTRRPGWPSAPTWGPATGPATACSSYDVDAGEIAVQRDGVRTLAHKSIFDFLDRELALNAVEPPPVVEPRPGRRLRRLPRLRAARPTAAPATSTAPTFPTPP